VIIPAEGECQIPRFNATVTLGVIKAVSHQKAKTAERSRKTGSEAICARSLCKHCHGQCGVRFPTMPWGYSPVYFCSPCSTQNQTL